MFKLKVTDKRDELHGKYATDASGDVHLLSYANNGDYEVYNKDMVVVANQTYEDLLFGKAYRDWKFFNTKEEADEQKRKETNQ